VSVDTYRFNDAATEAWAANVNVLEKNYEPYVGSYAQFGQSALLEG
jgi:hypothetical protein